MRYRFGSGVAVTLCGLALVWPLAAGAETLDLDRAISRTLDHNPGLAVYPHRLRAADAAVSQAGIRPSTELSVDLENLAGSGERSGVDGAEVTVALSQVIELGGQRDARVDSARQGVESERLAYRLARLDVLGEAARRYLQLATAQARLDLAQRAVELADGAESAAGRRVEAGAAPQSEQRRLALAGQAAGREQRRAEAALHTASQRLAALWGETGRTDLRAATGLTPLPALPSLDVIRQRLSDAPRLRRLATRTRLAESQSRLAEANASRDLTFSVGARRDRADDSNSAVLGFSMPLNLSDPNRGTRARRLAELDALDARREAERVELMALVEDLYRSLAAAREEAQSLEQESLPEARRLYRDIHGGYAAGRYSLLELIQARRERLDLEHRHLELAAAFHQQRNELERLTGQGLTENSPTDDRSREQEQAP